MAVSTPALTGMSGMSAIVSIFDLPLTLPGVKAYYDPIRRKIVNTTPTPDTISQLTEPVGDHNAVQAIEVQQPIDGRTYGGMEFVVNDLLEVAQHPDVQAQTSDFFAMAAFNTESTDLDTLFASRTGIVNGVDEGWCLIKNSDVMIAIMDAGDGTQKRYQIASGVNDGQWHTAAFMWENSTDTFTTYFDGVQALLLINKDDDLSGKDIDSGAGMAIGSLAGGAFPWGDGFAGDFVISKGVDWDPYVSILHDWMISRRGSVS